MLTPSRIGPGELYEREMLYHHRGAELGKADAMDSSGEASKGWKWCLSVQPEIDSIFIAR